MPRVRSTVTDADGRYVLARLIPGSYRVMFGTLSGAKRMLEASPDRARRYFGPRRVQVAIDFAI